MTCATRYLGLVGLLLSVLLGGCTRYGDIVPWPSGGRSMVVQVLDLDRELPIIYAQEGHISLDDAACAAVISHAKQHAPEGCQPWFLWVGGTFASPRGTQTTMVSLYYTPEVAAPRLRRGKFLRLEIIGAEVTSDRGLWEYGQVPPLGESFTISALPASPLLWPFRVYGSFTDDHLIEAAGLTQTIMAAGQSFAGKPIKVVLPSEDRPAILGPPGAFAPLPIQRIVRNADGSTTVWTGVQWSGLGGRGQHFEYLQRRDMYVIHRFGPWIS